MTVQEDRQSVRTQLGVNLVVEAGAGTGKTTLLIERLCLALLAQGIRAPRLVALTFTEKAAAEIKTRLIFQLQSVLRAAREDTAQPLLQLLREHFQVPLPDIIARAEEALAQLDRSSIGTIHGFCADILRMYPLEAGLTPQAEIDKGTRAQRIFDAQWYRFLDRELAAQAPRAAQWKEVLSRVTLADLYDCARELCSGKIQHYDYFKGKDVLIRICRERAARAQQLAEAFSAGKKKPRVIEQTLQQAAQRFGQAASWLETGTLPPQPQETIVIHSIPKDWDEASAEEAKALCRFAAQADPFVQSWILKTYDLLSGVTEEVRARYTAEGILSFDDLIVKTRDLLKQNLLVRRLLQEKYDALYIDEFQDTDPVQGELLLFLAEQKGGGASTWEQVRLEPGKLFVVGDPKQSIYRFRGADITAYELFTDLILKQGGQKAYLRQNFRSEREIVALANRVCSRVMTEKPAFQPAYEAIFTDRGQLSGAAEMALVCGEKAPADDFRHNQARFVAQWIEQQVGRRTLKDGRKLAYRDIAILSRAATTLGPYTDGLRRAGIPFSIEEDRDFYRRQEVADFLNLLRVLDDPQDRISLVGVMRSPLGALTDEEVYEASVRRELDYRQPSQNERLERLFVRLRVLAARAGREPLRKLLKDILQETFLAEACAAAYDGERSMNNLQRLAALAEGYSLQTPTTLGQFLARVQELMEQELGQLTALPDEGALDAVTVMTVHKSKGLQFPVVILVDISKQELASAAKRPMHLYSWQYDMHGLRVGKYADIHLAWLEEEQKEHARCEEVRVLYVALTRAQEKLLIVGNRQAEARTLADMFVRAGAFPPADENPAQLDGDEGLRLQYISFVPPEQFIYAHRSRSAALPAEWDWAAWRQTQAARQAEYARLKAQVLPLAPSEREAGAGDEAALQLGTRVHEALAWGWRTQQTDADRVWQAVCTAAEPVPAEAQEMVRAFWASAAYAHWRKLETLGVEMPFSLATEEGVVSGVMDLLLRDTDGTVWVLDYKTDRVPAGAEEAAGQKYAAQLAVYRRAAQALYPQARIRTAIIWVRSAALTEL